MKSEINYSLGPHSGTVRKKEKKNEKAEQGQKIDKLFMKIYRISELHFLLLVDGLKFLSLESEHMSEHSGSPLC